MQTANIMTANAQWANRPAEERYFGVAEAMAAMVAMAQASRSTAPLDPTALTVVADDNRLMIAGPSGGLADLSNNGMRQIAGLADAPAGYLSRLPASLAAAALEHGLHSRTHDGRVRLLIRRADSAPTIAAATGEGYSRIWHADVLRFLGGLIERGWKAPPCRPPANYTGEVRIAGPADVLSDQWGRLSINIGDRISGNVYASDRDMFALLVHEDRIIRIPGRDTPLSRAILVSNSETGDRALRITCIGYDHVCGNHILWGAVTLCDKRLRHVGDAADRWWHAANAGILAYDGESAGRIEEAMRRVVTLPAVAADNEAADRLMASRLALPVQTLATAREIAATAPELGTADPRGPWAYWCGLTRHSQTRSYAADREIIDSAAGKIIKF